jgi:hypothetical protein
VLTGVGAVFNIDLEWEVASQYVLRPVGSLGNEDFALYPSNDATFTFRRPLEVNPSLYAEFAKLDGSERGCLEFAQRYGPLQAQRFPDLTIDTYQHETLSLWRAAIDDIKRMIAICELGMRKPAEAFRQFGGRDFHLHGGIELYLAIKSSSAPPSIEVRCNYLLAAMEFQAIRSIISGRRTSQCIECSTWFEIGSGARRSQAKFCSVRCKDSYHNRLKAASKPDKRRKEA